MNRTTKYLIPLLLPISENKFPHVGKIRKEDTKAYVYIKNIQPTLLDLPNISIVIDKSGIEYIKIQIADKYIVDYTLFTLGLYSKFSNRAKTAIIKYYPKNISIQQALNPTTSLLDKLANKLSNNNNTDLNKILRTLHRLGQLESKETDFIEL